MRINPTNCLTTGQEAQESQRCCAKAHGGQDIQALEGVTPILKSNSKSIPKDWSVIAQLLSKQPAETQIIEITDYLLDGRGKM